MGVGVDIGSKSVKVVELSAEGSSVKLLGSGIVGYKGNTPDNIVDEAEAASLAAVVKKLHKEANIESKDIVISVPETKVFTRVIKFPLLTDQEISSAIKWEAEQYVPIPINEAVVRHQIISRVESGVSTGVYVLLVAVPKKLVELYVKIFQIAGLNVVKVETELIALSRVLAPRDRVSVIVDLGATSTDLAICKNGVLSFARSISTAGDAFTRALAQNLNINPTQAEEYKKAYGMSSQQLEGKVKNALNTVFALVAEEIKKAIYYYQTEEKGQAPTLMVLSGGTSAMPNAIAYLSNLLGIEVVVGNPFAKISITPEVLKMVSPYAPLYSVAVGLALSEYY